MAFELDYYLSVLSEEEKQALFRQILGKRLSVRDLENLDKKDRARVFAYFADGTSKHNGHCGRYNDSGKLKPHRWK